MLSHVLNQVNCCFHLFDIQTPVALIFANLFVIGYFLSNHQLVLICGIIHLLLSSLNTHAVVGQC